MSPSLGEIDGVRLPIERNGWILREDDFTLYAMLSDPVYMPEVVWKDPTNHDYGGAYRVHPEQYQINRCEEQTAVFACGRATGKTMGQKSHSQVHCFTSPAEDMLMTAPELIHLLPLTDAVEDSIRDSRLLRECLDVSYGKTGFTHRPFGVNLNDGTKLVGRIPKLKGPQPEDAGILTPTGWTTMGQVAAGDQVIGSDGRPTTVLGVTNSWESEIFRVEFTDGSSTETDATHLWTVEAQMANRQLRSTEDIAVDIAKPGKHKGKRAKHNGGDGNMWRVPPLPIVHFAAQEPLPLDPYVVGVLLGDGTISQHTAGFVSWDEEIIEAVTVRLPDGCSITRRPDRATHCTIKGPGRRGAANPVIRALKDLGLMGHKAPTKFIPDVYKYASPSDRLELLRGLLDTDGTVKDSGGAAFYSSSPQLMRDVIEVARSLGGWASSGTERIAEPTTLWLRQGPYDHPGGVYYRATLRIKGMVPFRLPRKAAKYRIAGKQRHKSIRAVVPVGYKRVRCIKVAAADGLYVTDEFIVTHNTGVLGQHAPFVMVEESQSYPEPGWKNLEETVNYDAVDKYGNPRWRYWAFGVHDGNRQSGFSERAKNDEWKVIQVTRLQRADWGKEAKERAKASYGSSSSPDYRRNILGEPGDAASAYFVTARLMSTVDQRVERGEVPGSDYNTKEYKAQRFRAEELDDIKMNVADALDLPHGYESIYGGVDVGLNRSPTVISLWTETMVQRKLRLKLFRRFTLERFRSKQIRQAMYAIDLHFGGALMGMGVDSTGLGLPIMQELEDDEVCPPHLMQVMRGYFFSSKVAVAVAPENVYRDEATGIVKDQYGRMLEEQTLPDGSKRFIVWAPFITASTNYLARWVDTGYLMLPFDQEVIQDMLGETKERVERLQKNAERAGGALRKPDIFHFLDSARAMAMSYHATDIEEALAIPQQQPVFDEAF